jgi:hypothetical protein
MEMPQNETQQKSEKLITKVSDEVERERGEKVLDEAIENTFPASDPVSAEQPVHAAPSGQCSGDGHDVSTASGISAASCRHHGIGYQRSHAANQARF